MSVDRHAQCKDGRHFKLNKMQNVTKKALHAAVSQKTPHFVVAISAKYVAFSDSQSTCEVQPATMSQLNAKTAGASLAQ